MSADDTTTCSAPFAAGRHGIGLDVNFDPIDRVLGRSVTLPGLACVCSRCQVCRCRPPTISPSCVATRTNVEADAYFTSALDEIAWALNIRSTDVPRNPRSHIVSLRFGRQRASLYRQCGNSPPRLRASILKDAGSGRLLLMARPLTI